MKAIAILSLALLVANTASARLLETVEQCNERYGPPTEANDKGDQKIQTYVKDTYKIKVTFLRTGKGSLFSSPPFVAQAIGYSRTDGKDLGSPEIELLLESNGGSAGRAAWSQPSKLSGEHFWSGARATVWERSDKAYAAYFYKEKVLFLNTESYAKTNYRDSKRLQGF